MTRQEILQSISESIRQIFRESPHITEQLETSALADWDSVMHISLLVDVERRLGVRIPIQKTLGLTRIGELIDVIQESADVNGAKKPS